MDFRASYSVESFSSFLGHLLPLDAHIERRTLVLGPTTKRISGGYQLGKSSAADVTVLELHYSGAGDARVALASEAFRIMADNLIWKALVAFVPDSGNEWRLSLMTIDLELTDSNAIVRRYSNARRYSFLVGPDAKTNTVTQSLVGRGRVADFYDLADRFSLETVNKQFFAEIASLYSELVGGTRKVGTKVLEFDQILVLPEQGEENLIDEFAVRLIGRLVFCWFLRQKHSAGGSPLVPTELLSSSAARGNAAYYEDTLEALFFETLNTPMQDRSGKFSQGVYATIPYLNGGLFEPHASDFYGARKTVPNDWLARLFAVFESYNFTIDENTSADVELSIDPEMLGRIFENLLAEVNPETGQSARKATGSYYTPRDVVGYMVDEVLIAHLENKTNVDAVVLRALISYDAHDDSEHQLSDNDRDEVLAALSDLKIIDPACGSGAFPMGILQKVVLMLQRADPKGEIWLANKLATVQDSLLSNLFAERFRDENLNYIRKLGVIQDTIFGVDIQPIAVEVSKLRCFLTLIVEEDVVDERPNRGIVSLPNLDFKFVCANSLIPLNRDNSLQFDGTTSDLEAKLGRIRREYFNAEKSKRPALRQQYEGLIGRSQLFGDAPGDQQLKSFNPFNPESSARFFDSTFMFGVKKFDICIGNPPYYKENDDRQRFEGLRKLSVYQGKMDVWYLFAAAGVDLLAAKGHLCFIATNNWTTNSGARKLRAKLVKETKLLQLLDFGQRYVFEDVGIQTMVMLLTKSATPKSYTFDYRRIRSRRPESESLGALLGKVEHSGNEYLSPILDRRLLADSTLNFSGAELTSILDRMAANAPTRFRDAEVAQGIVFPQDRLNARSALVLGTPHYAGEGVFLLSDAEVMKLNLSGTERDLLKPFYTSAALNRYYAEPKDSDWVIYTDSSFSSATAMDDFPNLKAHLDQFQEIITSSNKL